MIVTVSIMILFFMILFACIGYSGDEYKYAALFKMNGYWGGLKKIYALSSFRYSTFFFIYLMIAALRDSTYYPLSTLGVYIFLFAIWAWSVRDSILYMLNKRLGLIVSN